MFFYSADCLENYVLLLCSNYPGFRLNIDDQEVKIISIALGRGDSLSSRQALLSALMQFLKSGIS